ncbi:uncharacterized protein LOC127834828 isoform X2 [Dreissena polymorpha]|uniref:uncharacterized protein LOC127834828 isoform X2 n=1 Tax=Dreissena polymorpha TaxID=45954 RepID=UPI002263E287|nr:uncharacterized protein LOC127834828 isoform X2 [Dreissena polymorpha]
MGFTCAMVRHGTEPPTPGCISMEEAIMLHQALQGGPTGPGTGIIAPSRQQTVPSMNMLGINQQGGGFNQRFGQGIVGSPTTMFNQQQQPNSMAFDDLSMGPFPLGTQGFPMGGGGPFPPGMGGSNPFGTGMPQQFGGRNGFGGPQDMRFIDPTTGQPVAQRGPFPPVMGGPNSFANGMPRQFGGRNGFGGPQDMRFVDPTTGQLIPKSQFRVNQGSNQMHDKDHTGGNTNHLHGSAGVGAHSTGQSAGITACQVTKRCYPSHVCVRTWSIARGVHVERCHPCSWCRRYKTCKRKHDSTSAGNA